MSRIEELPDDFDESLNLNTTPQPETQYPNEALGIPEAALQNSIPFPLPPGADRRDGTTPALPPQMQSVRAHTADDIIKMMNRTPLFMTTLDETDGEGGENAELEALRALQYEGTKAEIAQDFREQGNEQAKAKQWKDAKEFYTKAIAVLTKKIKNGEESKQETANENEELDPEEEKKKEKTHEEACYINRALCNLELKNYRSCTLDCAAALRLNPENVKAFYRSSLALLALDKIEEAMDACTRGLKIDPKNTALKNTESKILARKSTLDAIATRKKAEQDRARKEALLLSTALRARNIKTKKTAQPPDMEDAKIKLTPDALSPESSLVFPVVLLYPMHAQSDFIKAFGEMDTLNNHLEYIFPLPWDTSNDYTIKEVDAYLETINGGLIKMGKRVPLLDILGGGKVEIVDELFKINVVPRKLAGEWIEEMKKRKAN
ncbi:MAG: hypothetical protein M1834_009615 [Cirrosporium novae-zelandiae]|nr:MAG: hypothetical protein M1834_009615 [Cirrosporium novae-zelandiae]